MRLFSLALGVVLGFGLGVWCISRLLPETAPEWLGVALCVVWLFMLIFAATLMSSTPRVIVKDQRRLLGYGLFAAILIASFLVPLFVYKVNIPKWAAKVVVFAIAAAVYWIYTYKERHKLDVRD